MNNAHLEIAIDIAQESGAHLAERFAAGVYAEAKGRFDIITDADHAVEHIILRRLRAECPSHTIVAEESGESAGTSSTYRWYVDPLDGTKNFARGYPAFSVSLALERDGELVVGVVFDPLRRELFAGERGSGSSCNGRPMRVSATGRLDQCLMATGFPSATRHSCSDLRLLTDLSLSTQGLRRTGSSALDLAYVAAARLDAFWDIGLKPWDVAAGALLVSEAGGCCTDLRGGRMMLGGTEFLADNGAVHDQLVRKFGEMLDLASQVTP